MYDARPNKLFGDGNLLFGIATIIVVGGCFAGAMMVPGLGGQADDAIVAEAETAISAPLADPEALNAALSSPDEQRFLKTLLAIAPDRYINLQQTFADETIDASSRMAIVQETAINTVIEQADLLSFASGQSLNRVLDGAIRDLKTAAGSGTKYCKGETYADVAGSPEAAVMNWASRQDLNDEDFYPTAMRMNADILELVRQAQTNPARHGLFTKSDEMEIQKVMISVMADPDVIGVMTAGDDKAGALTTLNVCAVGAKALGALRTLPDETKGRAWAAFLRRADVRQAIKSAQQKAAT
ncbi:MAG: hypothetical protein AAGJ32_08815 [Pseudomonadota bacterium]